MTSVFIATFPSCASKNLTVFWGKTVEACNSLEHLMAAKEGRFYSSVSSCAVKLEIV